MAGQYIMCLKFPLLTSFIVIIYALLHIYMQLDCTNTVGMWHKHIPSCFVLISRDLVAEHRMHWYIKSPK